MSLVSYAYSDSEGSEGEDSNEEPPKNTAQLTNGTTEPVTKSDKSPIIEQPPIVSNEASNGVVLPSKPQSWKLPPPKNVVEDLKTPNPTIKETVKPVEAIVSNPVQSLKLPAPKTSFVNVDWKDILVARSNFQPIKISAPALLQTTDEDEEELRKKKEKKRAPSSKSSGLFSILPQPKNEGTIFKSTPSSNSSTPSTSTATTVTTAVKRKKLSEEEIKKLQESKKRAGLPVKPPSKPKKLDDEGNASDDDDPPDSFFFVKTDDVQVMPIDDKFLEPVTPAVSSFANVQPQTEMPATVPEESYPTQMVEDVNAQNEYAQLPLDDSALRVLCGGGAKRKKKEFSEMEVIDVSGDTLVGDTSLALTKGITDEYRPSRLNSKKLVSSTSVRKHQITYLAAQAKELEHELKQQWGANRLTKKQTQSKYGF